MYQMKAGVNKRHMKESSAKVHKNSENTLDFFSHTSQVRIVVLLAHQVIADRTSLSSALSQINDLSFRLQSCITCRTKDQ